MNLRAAIVAVALMLSACSRDDWKGWMYPDAGDLTRSIELGRFDDFDACRDAAITAMRATRQPDLATFECGRGCRPYLDTGVEMCAETRD